MATGFVITLVLYLGITVAAVFLRSRGNSVAGLYIFFGMAGTLATAASLTDNIPAKYVLMGGATLLLVVLFVTMDRAVWRALRPVWWLCGATVLATLASYYFVSVSSAMQDGLLALVVVLSAALIVTMLLTGIRLLRSTHAK